MSRGLGELQTFVLLWARLDRRGGEVLLRDVYRGWAHDRASGGRKDRCDCHPGRCLLLRHSHEVAVRAAVASLEAKGLLVVRHDWYGRVVVRLSGQVPTWRPGQRGPHRGSDPGLCPSCGQPVDLMAS